MERETLSQNSEEPQESSRFDAGPADSADLPSDASFPAEPFACPHCGQMLGPKCRVCVSCKQPIDPRKIARPVVTLPAPEPSFLRVPTEYARFSWAIFFAVLAIWCAMALVAQHFLGYEKGQFVLGGVVIGSAAWVLYDAHKKGIPKGLRWSVGSLLIWILIFPWYLSRRETPERPCPFIEGETGRFARIILFVLVVFFLLGALAVVMKGPKLH